MKFTRLSRQEKIDYLLSNPNFIELRRHNRRIQAPADMSTAVLTRLVAGAKHSELTGEWVTSLGPWRGHTASEHHQGRGRKEGMETWTPPERIPRFFLQPVKYAVVGRGGKRESRTAQFTVTAGESIAARALAKAAREGFSVAFRLSGPLPGQDKYIFWKGGYNAHLLLLAAGYKRTQRGAYLKQPGGGLEKWLLDYLARMAPSPTTERWPLIALYQIFAKQFIDDADLVPEGRGRHYHIHKPGLPEHFYLPPIAPPHHPWTRKPRQR